MKCWNKWNRKGKAMSASEVAAKNTPKKLGSVELTAQEFQCVLDALQSHAKQIEEVANEYPGDSCIRASMNADAARSKSLIKRLQHAWLFSD
jgi:hypothetical protein